MDINAYFKRLSEGRYTLHIQDGCVWNNKVEYAIRWSSLAEMSVDAKHKA